MSNDRFTKDLGPEIPHRQSHEERDLRNDMYEAMSTIADAISTAGQYVQLEKVAPGSGVNTAVVRARALTGPGGSPVAAPVIFELAGFYEAEGVTPATPTAQLATATAGSILAGEGGAALKVKTNAVGLFECTLTDMVDESIFLSAFATPTGPSINCVGSLEVAFIP